MLKKRGSVERKVMTIMSNKDTDTQVPQTYKWDVLNEQGLK